MSATIEKNIGILKNENFHSLAPYLSFIAIILILLVGSISYSNTFHSPFIFDDAHIIVENKGIHVDSFSATDLAGLKQGIRGNRPVVMLSFALNYYFGGLNPFGYHLINLLIHVLTAIIIYFFLQLTLNLPSLREQYGKYAQTVALLSSLLFVAHPIQTQAVTYIVQRMASMAALFFLSSLYCYAKARLTGTGKRQIAYFLGSGLAALLALGSKENSVTLPFFIALYEYYFLSQPKLTRNRKKWLYIMIGLILLGSLLVGVFTGFSPVQQLNKIYQRYTFTPGQRTLTQLRIVIFYLGLLIAPLPSRLNLDHHFSISYSLLSPVVVSQLNIQASQGQVSFRHVRSGLNSLLIKLYRFRVVLLLLMSFSQPNHSRCKVWFKLEGLLVVVDSLGIITRCVIIAG